MPVKSKKAKLLPTRELRAAKAANKLLAEALKRTTDDLTTAHDAHEATRLAHSETLKKLEATERHARELRGDKASMPAFCAQCFRYGCDGSCVANALPQIATSQKGPQPITSCSLRCRIRAHFRKWGMEYLLIALICGAAAVFVWFAATAK